MIDIRMWLCRLLAPTVMLWSCASHAWAACAIQGDGLREDAELRARRQRQQVSVDTAITPHRSGAARSTKARSPGAPARFAKHDRARLAWLQSEGRQAATILIAYPPRQGNDLVRRLAALGGRVRYQSDTIGYLRVDLPTARVLEAAGLPGIDAINLNGGQAYGAFAEAEAGPPIADTGGTVRRHVAPPDASTPPVNPYLPMGDVGAPQFVRAHSTFDGRGVTIGSVECCPDFRHPVFREPALTLDGKPTRKLAALYTVVTDDSQATNRVHASNWVEALNQRITYEGVIYHAPHDGRFRFGYYTGPTGFKSQANWRADTLDSSSRRAVLLDPRSGEVWIDVLDDRDFTHSPPLRDYNTTGDLGAFGRDDPTTPWDDRLAVAVGVDTARGIVDLYPGNGGHITGVAGTAVGTHFWGSSATGAAPHARIVMVSAGGGWKADESHQSSRIEAMVFLAQRPDVDIITTQEWYDLRLKDGRSVWSVIADRLVATYHKILLQSAGNEGPGLGTVGEAGNGSRVIKVGGSIDRDTWYSLFALLADRKDYLFQSASGEDTHGPSRGPTAEGGTTPDVVGPFAQMIAWPVATSGDSTTGVNRGFFSAEAIYPNPPGYTVQFGTSLTAPAAAGVTALLVSAARQTHTLADPARVRWALSAGARYFPEYQAYEQGAGLLNASTAWDRLKHAPVPVDIAVDAPVRTILSPYLRTPGHGRGLYEREGWSAGDSATRRVTFTRTSGPERAMRYALRWLGNDGTFAAPSTVTLRLNAPVAVSVAVHPRTWGAHSALLQLIGADGTTPAQQMSAVVVAAHPLDAAHRYTLAEQGQVEWLGEKSYFVAVPPGAAALDLSLAVGQGVVRLLITDPTGRMYPSTTPFVRGRHYDWPADIAIGLTQQQSSGAIHRTIEYPEPGVWEVVVEHEGSANPELRLKQQTRATYTLTASVTHMTVGGTERGGVGSATGAGDSVRMVLHNDFAPVKGTVVAGPLASLAEERLTFRQGEPGVVRELTIDSGTTRLAVKLAQPSDSAADLDMYLFDCASGHCDHYTSAVFRGAEKELRVQHPRPGRWRLVIDPYAIPSGTTMVRYRDEIVHPKYGTAAVMNPLVQLASGGTAPLTVTLHPGVAPEPGRSRLLRLEVENPEEQTPSGPALRHGVTYPHGVLGVLHLDE